MKMIFLIICLVIVLVTLETLIVSGFHASTHRLLPLVLGLIALYDFYLIVELITGQTESFVILKELLLIQFLDVLLYFTLDFMRIKLSVAGNAVIVSLLIFMDVLLFVQASQNKDYHMAVTVFVIGSIIGLITLVLFKSPNRKEISNQARRNNHIMGLTLFIPSSALLLVELGFADADIILPLAADISCLILDYLFVTDRLREVASVLIEEHFHTLDVPAFLFDTEYFFLDASKKARELFKQEIEAISQSPQHYALQEQLKTIQSEGGVAYREIAGRFYRCQLQAAEYKGKKKGYILTFMDISDQKKETDMAKEVAKHKSEFLANMSHDLRSPLHAIIGSSEIALSRGEMSSKSLVMVNHIHEAGINLLDIVNSILDFSKLETGELKLYPQKYDFKKLVEEQARLGYINLRDSNVSLAIDIENPFPQYLYGDKLRVRQIIQNLLSNAIKFTDEGSIECAFDIEIENGKRVKITYSVKDTGTGLTKEQLETVFGDYVTFAREQKKEGTGLGLSIVKKLSEMMGGGAFVESDGKSGSTFTVSFYQELPSDTEDGEDLLINSMHIKSINEIQEDSVWKNDVTPEYTYSSGNVLLADDMDVNCEIFEAFTKPWKFRLDVACDGEEAVKLAGENHYDLIFLDQMMPKMTGLEAAVAMHENGIDVPMILLSANITESLKELSKEHGFTAFMNKPIDISQLKTYIEIFMPEELREKTDVKDASASMSDMTSKDSYIKALKTYISEMESLYELLPEYKENDLSMFRNKVHGIKGVSRQLGVRTVAIYAEIMEMAAISEHTAFIHDFFDAFMDELQYAISESKRTVNRLAEYLETEADKDISKLNEYNDEQISEEQIHELFDTLRKALEEYELPIIDETLETLGKAPLPDEYITVLSQVKEAYADMEYEDALNALNFVFKTD